MQFFNNVPLSREFSYPEESTIRRYYIETCSVARRPNLENFIQDGVDPYRFYSVVRRNYTSTELPFVVPKVFSHFTTNVSLFSTVDDGHRDYFDRGVTSTDDGDLLDDAAFPLQTDSPPFRHSSPPNRSKKVLEAQQSDDHDTSNFFEQPFQDNLNYNDETTIEQFQSQSLKEPVLRLSDKNSFKSKSPRLKSKGQTPIKLSRSLSKSSINFESPSIGSNRPILELDDLKSSRGSDKSKKSIRPSSTSNSLYKLDRKVTPGPRRVMGSKISQKETQHALKVTKKGPYQIIRGPRKLVGVHKPLPITDNKTKETKEIKKATKQIQRKKDELALLEGQRPSDTDYDMGGFDSLEDEHMKLKRLKRGSIVRRRPRPSLSSSGFLNSMYITARSTNDEKEVLYLEDQQPTTSITNRYPKRIRRPVSPYWISNVASDGSSVVFLAGVCSQDSSKSNYLNDGMVPDSSLVLTNDHGEVKLQVVNKDSNDPNQKTLSEYVKNINPITIRNTPKRLINGRKKLIKPKRRLNDSKGSMSGSEVLRLEDDDRDRYKKEYKEYNKKKKIRKRKDLTLEEALAILEQAKSDDEREEMELEYKRKEIKNKSQEVNKRKRKKMEKVMKNWEKFHSENLKEEDKLDSFVEEQTDVYYYKAMYRQGEQISMYEDGVRFTPMIMNSQCRTSEILIPSGQTLDFGNLNSNFICGFVYSGSEIEIRGDEEQRTVNQNDLFFLPSFKECSIVNKKSDSEAHITFTFVNI